MVTGLSVMSSSFTPPSFLLELMGGLGLLGVWWEPERNMPPIPAADSERGIPRIGAVAKIQRSGLAILTEKNNTG